MLLIPATMPSTIGILLATRLGILLVFVIALTQSLSLTRLGLSSPALTESNNTVYYAPSIINSSTATAPSATTNPTPPPS